MKLGYLTLVFSVTAITAVRAFRPGEIPLNVAVRSTGDGELKFFRKKDEIEHLKKKSIIENFNPPTQIAEKRQSTDDPLLKDYEPVAMSGGELKAFTGAGAGQ